MKAVICNEFAPLDQLAFGEWPLPVAGNDDACDERISVSGSVDCDAIGCDSPGSSVKKAAKSPGIGR